MQKPMFILVLIAICIALVNAKEKCGPNEEYYDDCMPYRGTCNFSGYSRNICMRGCGCKEGYKSASHEDRTCVPIGPSCK